MYNLNSTSVPHRVSRWENVPQPSLGSSLLGLVGEAGNAVNDSFRSLLGAETRANGSFGSPLGLVGGAGNSHRSGNAGGALLGLIGGAGNSANRLDAAAFSGFLGGR